MDLEPKFRRLPESSLRGVDSATRTLTSLAKAEVELEDLLGVRRRRNYPPERPLLPGNVVHQAEHDAAELRDRLGLGGAPILDIVTLLETELGARVYTRRLDPKVSGLFVFDDALGACILLNANHPLTRRVHTAAHELGHFLSTRREPEILELNRPARSREEVYANAFARAFLMPARSVKARFEEVTAGADRLTRRHIIVLSHMLRVSRQATVQRLEELGLTKQGTWSWFEANGGITDEQARQVLGDLWKLYDDDGAGRSVSLRLGLLVAQVWQKGLLSEGQIARLLELDRIELRALLDDAGGVDAGPVVEAADLF